LIANAWMQNPVGYRLEGGVARLADPLAVVGQSFAIHEVLHTLLGAYVLSCFFVLGISASYLLRGRNTALFSRVVRFASPVALVLALLLVLQGHWHGSEVARIQPAKLAAMESLWETKKNAPLYLIQIPAPAQEKNVVELFGIPSFLSLLAYHRPDAEVKGLKEFAPEDRPPVWLTFASFRLMVGLGFWFVVLALLAFLSRKEPEKRRWLLRLLIINLPLPYLACEAGWIVAEVGRQPWIVYGLMRTAEAASPITPGQIAVTLAAFVAVYGFLGGAAFYLIGRVIGQGPEQKRPAGGEA